LVLCTVALLLASASPAVSGQAGGTGVHYGLVIACPGSNGVSVSTQNSPIGCPVRLVDGQDEMGDPSLAVDPFQPQNLIVASLHGTSGINGAPDARARFGQEFTTFTSTDAGQNWADNPFTPPNKIGAGAFGITPAITIDPYGHVFVGSLYAVPNGGNSSVPNFSSVIAAQKFASLRTINSQQNGAYHATYLDSVYKSNAIRKMWFLFDPATENMTLVWHEHPRTLADQPCLTDTAHTTVGQYYAVLGAVGSTARLYEESNNLPDLQTYETCPSNPDQVVTGIAGAAAANVPAVAKSQSGPAPTSLPAGLTLPAVASMSGNSTNTTSSTHGPGSNSTSPTHTPSHPYGDQQRSQLPPPHSVIGIAWTGASLNTSYHRQDVRWAIGPCSDSTNPVLSDGFLYIGCVADPSEAPFPWHNTTVKGTVELFRMAPSGGKPVYLGASPVVGGSPKLGVRSDGRLALISTNATKDGALELSAAFGHYTNRTGAGGSITWTSVDHYGDKITRINPAERVVAANVQDLIYREHSGVLHFILKEHIQPVGLGVASTQAQLAPHIRKSLVALDEHYGVLWNHGLDIGNLVNRSSDPTLMQQDEVAYDDLSDDFLQLPIQNYTWDGKDLGPAYQREFFAVGDYGQVQFAEVIEITDLLGPAAARPFGNPVPLPAPAAASTSVLVPAAGISVSTLMAGAFVAHRKKSPAAILAKLKK